MSQLPKQNLPLETDVFSLLKRDYEEKSSRNPRFSLRAYARQLGFSAATLSRILSGKREISKRSARQIVACLAKDRPEFGVWLEKPDSESLSLFFQHASYTQLEIMELSLISDWYYFAILSLAEIPGFKMNAQWISNRLNITKTQASSALEVLQKLKLLIQHSTGAWGCSGKRLSTSDRVRNLSVRKLNAQSLELASNSLYALDDEDLFQKTDYSGVTMAIDPDRITEANRRIRGFRRKLCKYLESGQKKEVYRLAIQLFPLSRREGE